MNRSGLGGQTEAQMVGREAGGCHSDTRGLLAPLIHAGPRPTLKQAGGPNVPWQRGRNSGVETLNLSFRSH
jgi:hypothetical protein